MIKYTGSIVGLPLMGRWQHPGGKGFEKTVSA